MTGWILLGVVVALGLVVALGYNGLVTRRHRVEAAWAQIDVQLKRRADLIPNLVEIVRSYVTHERETLEAVTQARAAALQAGGGAGRAAEQAQAEHVLTSTLKALFSVIEAYPELRADQGFLALQEELSGTEGRVAYARQFYNDTVLGYNARIQSFPFLLVAGPLRFGAQEYFEAHDTSRGPVQVDA